MSDLDAPPPSQSPASRSSPRAQVTRTGVLAWMTKNPVASNLLMLVLIIGGLLTLPSIKQEVFPEFELDLILINVAYPGASPAEVEQGVILAVEEAVRAIDGIKEVRATAAEGVGVVVVELMHGENADRALADVKSAVDRITSFPKDVERPIVSLALNRRQVNRHGLLGCLAQARMLLVQLAEHRSETLLKPQQVVITEEGVVLTGGLEPRHDEFFQSLLWPCCSNCLVLFPEEQAHELHRVVNLQQVAMLYLHCQHPGLRER